LLELSVDVQAGPEHVLVTKELGADHWKNFSVSDVEGSLDSPEVVQPRVQVDDARWVSGLLLLVNRQVSSEAADLSLGHLLGVEEKDLLDEDFFEQLFRSVLGVVHNLNSSLIFLLCLCLTLASSLSLLRLSLHLLIEQGIKAHSLVNKASFDEGEGAVYLIHILQLTLVEEFIIEERKENIFRLEVFVVSVVGHLILGGVLVFFRRNVGEDISVRLLIFFSHEVEQELKLISVHLNLRLVDSLDELILRDIAIAFNISIS